MAGGVQRWGLQGGWHLERAWGPAGGCPRLALASHSCARLTCLAAPPLPPPSSPPQDCKAKTPAPGKLKEFGAYLAAEGAARDDVRALQKEVHDFAASFPMPGGDW